MQKRSLIALLLCFFLFTGSATRCSGQAAGATAGDLVRRALQGNRDLAAARLNFQRARARLRQAGLLPNPALDLHVATGRLAGDPGEREVTVGVAVPIELGGKRQRRIELAEAELAASEAEVADRERQLARDVLAAYADAAAALRTLQITREIQRLDEQTADAVQARVTQGDTGQLELSLLQTEVGRLGSQGALLQGRAEAAVITLKNLIGEPPEGPLNISEQLPAEAGNPLPIPATLEEAIETALQERPDLQMARLNERTAEAGLALARAEGFPELTVSGGFTSSRQMTDLPAPLLPEPQRDQTVSVGASISLPFFNRNQGARAESTVAIQQAQERRQFTEQVVRAEVTGAFRRVEASRSAVQILEQSVIHRSADNLRVMRAAYDLGEYRVTDLITEQRRVLDAQQEYANAVAEHYRAVVDLAAAMGTKLGGQP